MTKLNEIYQCSICGNVVEIVNDAQGQLVCCDKPMSKLEAKTQDAGNEKHVPVIEELDKGLKIKVGSVSHPMEEEHYIKFIEILKKDRVCRIPLNPGDSTEIVCDCLKKDDIIEVREFCTVHGLWKNAE